MDTYVGSTLKSGRLRLGAVIVGASLLATFVGGPAAAAPAPVPSDPPAATQPEADDTFVPTRAHFEAAATVDMSLFQAGYLIAGAQFFDGDALTQAEIQQFLESKGPSCALSYCLDTYRETTATVAPSTRCNGYTGAPDELASQIIFKVQASCNVSAKVILVTLEKEQGLITGSFPKTDAGLATFVKKLTRAMGYYCPDDGTGQCHPDFAGFHRQVNNGAAAFQRYRLNPAGYNFQPGTEYIQYNPDPTCGGSFVEVRNQATAGLYNYTPYQPNAAALAATPGTAPCGAYGNRNFWLFYTSWFGNPRAYPLSSTAARIDGADRYQVASNLATAAYGSASTVYVANGLNFPDGLVSAPAAARIGAPLLLTDPGWLPPSTVQAIEKLRPSKIVVVGGEASVSAGVYAQLEALVGPAGIRRDAGDDRYSAALAIARAGFVSAPTVYLVTGENFPDALSTSAAAGAAAAPILLVRPWDTELDQPTRDLLRSLGTTSVVIAGGPSSVSPALETWLRTSGTVASVVRQQGADRYAAGLAVNRAAFPSATQAFVASGQNFPDAMAGAAVAAARRAPLLLSYGACTSSEILAYLDAAGVDSTTFLGGTSSISPAAAQFESCS